MRELSHLQGPEGQVSGLPLAWQDQGTGSLWLEPPPIGWQRVAEDSDVARSAPSHFALRGFGRRELHELGPLVPATGNIGIGLKHVSETADILCHPNISILDRKS